MTNENENPNAKGATEVAPRNPRGRPKAPSLRELFLRVATQNSSDRDTTRLEAVMQNVLLTGSCGNRFNAKLVLALAREFLPDAQGGVELENGEYIPAKMTAERERDLTRFLGFDPDKK